MKHGVKETEEMIIAINELACFLVTQFKDGVQFKDFYELYKKLSDDDSFKQKMFDAYRGVSAVPQELGDLDVQEVVGLTSLQLSYIPKILDSLKKPL